MKKAGFRLKAGGRFDCLGSSGVQIPFIRMRPCRRACGDMFEPVRSLRVVLGVPPFSLHRLLVVRKRKIALASGRVSVACRLVADKQVRLHSLGKRQVFLAVAVNRDRNGRRQQTIRQRFIKRILDLLISCSIFLHDMIFKPE